MVRRSKQSADLITQSTLGEEDPRGPEKGTPGIEEER